MPQEGELTLPQGCRCVKVCQLAVDKAIRTIGSICLAVCEMQLRYGACFT